MLSLLFVLAITASSASARVPTAAALAHVAAVRAAGGNWAALATPPPHGSGRHLFPLPLPAAPNFFCERFTPACSQYLSYASCAVGATSVIGCGGAGNGTLDYFVGGNTSCACSSPYVVSELASNQVSALLWDAAVGSPTNVVTFQAAGAATYGNQTDIAATFGYLCFSNLYSMGCPIGKIAVLPPALDGSQNGTCRCGPQGNFDFGIAAMGSVTDALVFNTKNFIATQVLDVGCSADSPSARSPTDFSELLMCNPQGFPLLCQAYLNATNCSSPINTVGGCSNPERSSYADFTGQCACLAPQSIDVTARLVRTIFDMHIKYNMSSLVVNATPNELVFPGPIVLNPTFNQVCQAGLGLVGCCGDGNTATMPSSDAYLCQCGSARADPYPVTTNRTLELIISTLLGPFMQQAAADAAAFQFPSPSPSPRPGGITVAEASLGGTVAFLVLVLIGVVVFICYLQSQIRFLKGQQKVPPQFFSCLNRCGCAVALVQRMMPVRPATTTRVASDWAKAPQRLTSRALDFRPTISPLAGVALPGEAGAAATSATAAGAAPALLIGEPQQQQPAVAQQLLPVPAMPPPGLAAPTPTADFEPDEQNAPPPYYEDESTA